MNIVQDECLLSCLQDCRLDRKRSARRVKPCPVELGKVRLGFARNFYSLYPRRQLLMPQYNVCFLSALIALSLQGCSLSDSSKASSDSVFSIVSSPSESSDSSDEENQYQEDVLDYTYAYVKSSAADFDSFRKGIADIAAKHGILNWEDEPNTYIAVGKALKKAKLEGVAYETYKKNLAGGNYEKMKDIQKGYDFKKD